MPTRILPLLLAALLLAPAVAEARLPSMAQDLQTADQAWPWSPCAGRLRVVTDTTLMPAGFDGEVDMLDGTCDLHIAPGLGDRRCDVIVHEAGHRAGLGHTQHGVMAVSAEKWPPCHPVVPLRRQYHDALRSLLPVPFASWRTACGPVAHVTRCRAERPGSVVRRYRVQLLRRSFVVRELGGNWASFTLEGI